GMSSVVQELRDVINALRPVVLENLGLVPAIGAHLSIFRDQTGVKAHLEDKLAEYRLPASTEVAFFRLFQEALTNVRKHANATSVWVTLECPDKLFKMSVTDNGVGFDPKATLRLLESGHIGLQSMQERIDAIRGGMEIDSTPGAGTRVTFWCQE
ncbi:MAG: sensor histidine kinase, partial [Chloroflexia bacterium]